MNAQAKPSRAADQRAALVLTAICGVTITAAVVLGRAEARDGVFRPSDPGTVVARVPARRLDARARAIAALEQQIAARPGDAALAGALAHQCVEAARATGDPRYLGRAQAALGPWWDAPEPADDHVLRLRAIIKQARHQFDAALGDLERLLRRSPHDGEAWLVHAGLLRLRGRHAEAARSCDRLAELASPFLVAVCAAPSAAARGSAADAIAALAARLPEARADERAWGHSVLGELLFWAGELAAAERVLRLALVLAPEDRYTRALLADVLLDAGRAGDVPALLGGAAARDDDALLLRLAIAQRRSGGDWRPAADQLRARFAAERARGDELHGREEARFALAIDADPARALALARANWAVQREPWDARVLLAAARAAHDDAVIGAVAAVVRGAAGGWAQVDGDATTHVTRATP